MSGAHALSGRAREEITLGAVLSGELGPDDVRIHPDTLRTQAETAEAHGNPQLGLNLRRAAELALLDDAEVMRLYEALRPGRSSGEELDALVARLDTAGAALCAALVAEAVAVYRRRGLLR